MLDVPVETVGSRFGGIPSGLAHVRCAAVPHRPDPAAAACGADGRAPVRRGEPAVGDGGRLDDRRRPQLARRAARAGGRQPVGADRRRHPGHWRDRPHGDERPRRRCLAGRWPRPRRGRCWRSCSWRHRSPATSRWRRSPPSCSWWRGTWASGARSRASSGSTKTDGRVWLVTLALTVLADLTVAVEVGMVLAALLYVYRVSETSSCPSSRPSTSRKGRCTACSSRTCRPT